MLLQSDWEPGLARRRRWRRGKVEDQRPRGQEPSRLQVQRRKLLLLWEAGWGQEQQQQVLSQASEEWLELWQHSLQEDRQGRRDSLGCSDGWQKVFPGQTPSAGHSSALPCWTGAGVKERSGRAQLPASKPSNETETAQAQGTINSTV